MRIPCHDWGKTRNPAIVVTDEEYGQMNEAANTPLQFERYDRNPGMWQYKGELDTLRQAGLADWAAAVDDLNDQRHSVHEAGHAVVRIHLGLRVESVRLAKGMGDWGCCNPAKPLGDIQSEIVFLLAGEAAESLVADEPVDWSEVSVDAVNVRKRLSEEFGDPYKYGLAEADDARENRIEKQAAAALVHYRSETEGEISRLKEPILSLAAKLREWSLECDYIPGEYVHAFVEAALRNVDPAPMVSDD
jgi:hypothetical protein